MINVSGVLRKALTQAAPNPRSTGTGETRIAASSTPSTSAVSVDAPVSRAIHQKPVRYSSRFVGSLKTSIATSLAPPAGIRERGRPPAGPARLPGHWQLVNLLVSG